ncbi:hypothetical protein RHMOL_Rhmol01G0381200 [Rhododendron molle]|uniref:Uncharacterized protein n=1 Tax=Rhododendron molle TaxID=49168 RepID=A0ACC0QDI3_RHOML|nr:hypothetical protein RHMOL_Rhmol01G0381200 [Rhododendron molle]
MHRKNCTRTRSYTFFCICLCDSLICCSTERLPEMSDEIGGVTNGDSLEKLRALQITSLDDEALVNAGGDFSDDEDEELLPVTLVFLEKPENRCSLVRQGFPSKAGGVPAWLDPVSLPSGKSCLCDICGEPLQFLLQVYAPLSEKEPAFHRTLFVFMCLSMACLLQDQNEQWKRKPEKASRRYQFGSTHSS